MSATPAIAPIAAKLNLRTPQVESVLDLLADGATIPFIARYRKERTGSLDEVQLRQIEEAYKSEVALAERKSFILKTLEAEGHLHDALGQSIEDATDMTVLEDLYLPFKKKRKTKATKARELGLGPLAAQLRRQENGVLDQLAQPFLNRDVKSTEDALEGARHILAEELAETAWIRQKLRGDFLRHATIEAKGVKGKEKDGVKFRDYFSHHEKLSRCPSHRLLALLRGEKEGFLHLKIEVDSERSLAPIFRRLIRNQTPAARQVELAIEDAYKRLLAPSLSNEARAYYKSQADQVAVDIFNKNLQQLLLAPPLGSKTVMALDPGFRTGCKLVVLDRQGDLLLHDTIFPHPPQLQKDEAIRKVAQYCKKYKIEAIAIGDGTAGRETQDFLRTVSLPYRPEIYQVSESGASVYSASEVAREEFPEHDVTVRGAISIGRRLMDPLAELVKIDPKSIGVGQYQHDVPPSQLKAQLDATVISCVNKVGIQLNTASRHLLQYVSGLGPALAQNIVDYRRENGPFRQRKELLNVPRLGAKAYEQCAGFLRIRNGANPLDNTAVHPESYAIVTEMAKTNDLSIQQLLASRSTLDNLDPAQFTTDQAGIPTIIDIIDALKHPGLDPRGEAKAFSFHPDIRSMEDLQVGMRLPGLVTNVTRFGAFVNLGIKQDGLIHISQMNLKPGDSAGDQYPLGTAVEVKILEVDLERKRIQLAPSNH